MAEKARKPQIRFAGFEGDWEQRKLKTITTEKLSNGVINRVGTESFNVKHINVINMYTHDKIHTEDLTPSAYDESIVLKCNVEVGDIFMTRSSLKPEGIAEANLLLDSGRYVFDDHLIRMKVDKAKYDPMFVKIYFGSKMIKSQFVTKAKTTAFTTIGQEDISECEGMFPVFDEQKRIGEIFMNIDNLITYHQHKYDKLVNFKKSMLEKMFPKNGADVPEIRFKGFTEAWEQRKLREVGTITTGSTPSTAVSAYYSDDGMIWVTPTDISQNITYETEKKLSELGQQVGRIVPKNTILVTCIASIGKNTMLGNAGSFNQQINGLTPNEDKYEPYFLLTESALWSAQMKKSAAAGTMQIVNRTEFSELQTWAPSLDEQKKIGEYFKSLDRLITLHKHKLDKLKNLKNACLEKMFV